MCINFWLLNMNKVLGIYISQYVLTAITNNPKSQQHLFLAHAIIQWGSLGSWRRVPPPQSFRDVLSFHHVDLLCFVFHPQKPQSIPPDTFASGHAKEEGAWRFQDLGLLSITSNHILLATTHSRAPPKQGAWERYSCVFRIKKKEFVEYVALFYYSACSSFPPYLRCLKQWNKSFSKMTFSHLIFYVYKLVIQESPRQLIHLFWVLLIVHIHLPRFWRCCFNIKKHSSFSCLILLSVNLR